MKELPITAQMYKDRFGEEPTPEQLILWAIYDDDYRHENNPVSNE